MTSSPTTRILTINRGSSTVKSALYEAVSASPTQDNNKLLLSIAIDAGPSGRRLTITDPHGAALADLPVDGGEDNGESDAKSDGDLEAMFRWLGDHGFLGALSAVGHRLVHGGPRYRDPQRITPQFLSDIAELVPLDPEHLPLAIRGIHFIAYKFPRLPQIACFDTAFHADLPRVARLYALPRRLSDRGILRYGFHGLSYEYVMRELRSLDADRASGRVIVAHLGSGASIAAIREGKSIDTSMGFTPLEGLVMSTRSGDVDPGILLYLSNLQKMSSTESPTESPIESPKQMDTILNRESGLLGVSDSTGDMRKLLDNMHRDTRAAEAVDLFCYRVKKYIGAYAAALGGLDILVFAGGIGERAPVIRRKICEGLDFLGIRLDAEANEATAAVLSSAGSAVKVRVLKTDENLMIARHVLATLAASLA